MTTPNRLRILNVEPLGYSEEARACLQQIGEVVDRPLSRQELRNQLGEYDLLIVRLGHQIDREIIDAGRRLRAIVTATTGLDHIDVDYARARGVAVLSLQGEETFLRTVSASAEHTWTLLLAAVRRVPAAVASVQHGEWDRDAFRGHELDGKRLGIAGLGRIGRKVARYGLAFGMQVTAFDPRAREWMDGVLRAGTLEELLQASEVLSLHVPLNAETGGMIGARELGLLPAGAVLVNTSRGEVLDEAALVGALEQGRLAAAALDVVQHEREPVKRQESPLWTYARSHDNLLITPHVGGATWESMAKTEVFMARKLVAFVTQGVSPSNALTVAVEHHA